MRSVLQRVSEASVSVEGKEIASIGQGFLIFLGIEIEDSLQDVKWLSKKIAKLRIFSDLGGKMNKSIIDIDGDIIVVSQFTLHAKTKKGNRPSYVNSAKPEIAIPLYEDFKRYLSIEIEKEIQSGRFGSDMQVHLKNDGPVTIIIDTKNKQ